ncbi:flagellin, partial [Gammaproteobacteria bacterium]|nr:flagellin [Gammaproteobacteria bacterium]
STGVTAHSEDNKVVLFDADGDDITIENLQTLAGHDDLRVRKIDESGSILQADGVTTNWVGGEVGLAVSSSTSFDSTRVTGTLKMTSPNAFSVDQKVRQSGAITGNTTKNHVDPKVTSISVDAAQDLALFQNGVGTIGAGGTTFTASTNWSGGNLSFAADGMESSEVAREIRISGTGDSAARTFTITGKLADGTSTTETITGVNANTVSGSKKFLSISSIAVDGNVTGAVKVGYGGKPSSIESTTIVVENLVGTQQYVVGDIISFPGTELGSTSESPILHRVITAPDQVSGSPNKQTLTISPPIGQDKATLSLMAGIAADPDGIGSYANTNTGALTINGALASGGSVNLNPDNGNPEGFARQVTLTFASGTNDDVTFTITGTDASGKVLKEEIVGTNGASTATGLEKFLTITSVSAGSAVEGAVTVGVLATTAPTLTIETPGYAIDGAQTASLHNLTQVNISTMLQAGDSISIIDAALDKVAQMRANLGAIENRLDYTITNLMNIGERTADSRSRLLDADYALESSRLAKAQVIQQAGTQMLSQANQMTQMVLDLLR